MPIYVIGGANVDITSKSQDDLVLHDSNISKITLSFGGVARNVAENLANLDANVSFVTVFGNDILADAMKADLKSKGIDISYSFDSDLTQSTYLSILDSTNDMFAAFNDMEVLDSLNDTDLDELASVITDKDFIFIDANLKEEVIQYVLRDFRGFKVADTTSGIKCDRFYNHLGFIDLLKVNKAEAKELTEVEINDEKDFLFAFKKFKELGSKEVVITTIDGFYYSDGSKIYHYTHNSNKEIVNATGAGDSISAGLTFAKSEGYELDFGLKFAMAMARINVQSINTVASVDKDTVVDRANNNEYKGELIYEF